MMKIKLYMCGDEPSLTEYHMGLGYLKTNCKDAEVEIVQNRADLVDCDLIGLTATAHGIKEAISILYSTSIPVIIGGYGTLWDGLQDYDFKHIIIGEGEIAFQKIIDGSTQKVMREPLIEDIDVLNFPDRGKCGVVVPIFSIRGCPFNCKYCSSHAFWKKARYSSPEYFIEEVEYALKKYPESKGIYLVDDLFIANKKRFYRIHDLWMEKELNKRTQLTGYVRASLFTEEIGLAMKEMHFGSIRFGAESGSNRMLKFLNKQATVEDNQRTIDIANKIGLPVTAAFMYGAPTETPEEKQATIDFIKRNYGKVGRGGWYKFIAYPGTDLYAGANPLTDEMNFRGNIGQNGLCDWGKDKR